MSAVVFFVLSLAWAMAAHAIVLWSVGRFGVGTSTATIADVIRRDAPWVLPGVVVLNGAIMGVVLMRDWRTPWWRMLGVLLTLGTAVTVAVGRGLPGTLWRGTLPAGFTSVRWERILPVVIGLATTWFVTWLLVGAVRAAVVVDEPSEPRSPDA